METEKTIVELWDRFQKLGNYIETEKILKSWGTKGSDGLSHDGRNHSSDEQEMKSLRQQLLERCSKIVEDDHNAIRFSIQYVTFPDVDEGIDGATVVEARGSTSNLYATASKARDIGSAWLFMAWELEQRRKEKQNGN